MTYMCPPPHMTHMNRIIKELRKKEEDMLVRKKEEDKLEAQIAGVGLLIGTHQMPSSQGLVCVCVCVCV